MKYLPQIYDDGALEEFQRRSPEEQDAIVREFAAITDSPGVITGDQLQPADTSTTVRVQSGRRCSATARTSTRRSTSAAST